MIHWWCHEKSSSGIPKLLIDNRKKNVINVIETENLWKMDNYEKKFQMLKIVFNFNWNSFSLKQCIHLCPDSCFIPKSTRFKTHKHHQWSSPHFFFMLFIYISSFYSRGFHMKNESDMFTKTRRSWKKTQPVVFLILKKNMKKEEVKVLGRATQRHACY